jgi:hypothetical protein
MRHKIVKILKEFSEVQTNLSSEAARRKIADSIVETCLSKGKTLLLEENKTLKEEIRELKETLNTVLSNLDS